MIYCKNEFCIYNKGQKCISNNAILDSFGHCAMAIRISADHFLDTIEAVKKEYANSLSNDTKSLMLKQNIINSYEAMVVNHTLTQQLAKKKKKN